MLNLWGAPWCWRAGKRSYPYLPSAMRKPTANLQEIYKTRILLFQNLHAQLRTPWWASLTSRNRSIFSFGDFCGCPTNQQPKRLRRYKSSHLWLHQLGKVSNFFSCWKTRKQLELPNGHADQHGLVLQTIATTMHVFEAFKAENSPGDQKKSLCFWKKYTQIRGVLFQHMATFRSWQIFNLFPSVRKVIFTLT